MYVCMCTRMRENFKLFLFFACERERGRERERESKRAREREKEEEEGEVEKKKEKIDFVLSIYPAHLFARMYTYTEAHIAHAIYT